MMSSRLCLVAVLLVGVVNSHLVSLRSSPLATEYESFQVFVACAGSNFDFGAGIPVTRRHVLTAGSLVRGFLNWNVGFGSGSLNKLEYIESHVGYVHPNFNSVTFNNNVGIIVLPRSFPTGLVTPITMPSASDASFPRVNQEGKLIGFGVINNTTMAKPSPNPTLKTVYLTVTSKCDAYFKGTDTVRNFCANDENANSMNLCRGDLGSAFVVTMRGKKILAGIASTVSESCQSSERTSFTRVQSYLPWIAAVTGNAEAF